jgi:putative ABC transport system ATP-binding protein
MKDMATGPQRFVEAENLYKLYRVGDTVIHAVRDVSLNVNSGEFVCLMGPSGSGKTTLLHLLGGLDRPTRGTLRIADQETNDLTEGQFAALRHSKIGFIFQSFNLIPFLSAVENVELPLIFEDISRPALRTRALRMLDLVGLSHRAEHSPARLSGGEQQRVAIARALISNPSLVLADEPTANLDRRAGREVVRQLRSLCDEMEVAVVACTHDPDVAAEATRTLMMEDGQVTQADDSPRVGQEPTPPGHR